MEINLLRNYPQERRDLEARAMKKTEAVRTIARQFGKDYFDGERLKNFRNHAYFEWDY